MDAYHHQRRFAGSGDAPPPQPPPQASHHWYPGPAPPYPPHASHPFPPQHHQWGPPHDLQHQRHPPPPPPQQQPPPPYGYQPSIPGMPMHPPPPATAGPWPPHHAAAQPPPPSYPPPPPGQAWTNHSWAQNHGYAVHGNEEDWATKAKAWAAAKSVTENHHMQQHAISTNRPEAHNYGYQDQYQQPAGLPTEPLRPPIPQSSNDQLPFQTTGQHKNYLPDGGPMAPPTNNFGSFPSTYEQEVSYNYSSASGLGNAMLQYPSSQAQTPPTAFQDGFPRAPSNMHVAPPLQQPHFGHDGQSSKIVIDPSDQPLEFNSRKAPDMAVHKTANFGSTMPAAPIAVSDHDAHSASNQSWASSTTVLFPQAPVPPQAAQVHIDPSVHAAPLFGAVSGSIYVPPAAFGVGMTEAFPVDANTPFNVAERSKKPPVPNWLREELLKKKSTSVNTSVQHSTEFRSTGSEDTGKTFRSADQADSRSVDSAKSTDDDDEDEDEIEAARVAAINQEIKRVLTEVLLKVTDDLFDEIATKVLDEDDSSAEYNEPTRVSSLKGLGLEESKSKISAKVVVPAKQTNVSSADHSDGTGLSSPKGALLGLASYDSDDDDDEGDVEIKIPKSNLSSETKASTAHPEEDANNTGGEQNGNHNDRNSVIQSGSSGEDHKFNDERSERSSTTKHDQELSTHEMHVREFPLDAKISSQQKDVVPTVHEKAHGYFQNGKVSPDNHSENYSNVESSHKQLRKSSNEEDSVKEPKAVRRKEPESSEKCYDDDKSSMCGNIDKKGSFKEEKGSDRSAKHGADTREPHSRGNSKQDEAKGDRKDYQKDIRDRNRDSTDRREKGKPEREDKSRHITKGSSSHSSRRSRSPSVRSRTRKENSSHRESISSDERSDNMKRRKLHSRKSSMSPSPPKSRNRRVSPSPHSKHSHSRHSPYSSAERKKRSRSRTPVTRR